MIKFLLILAMAANGLGDDDTAVVVEDEGEKFHWLGHEFDRTPVGDAVDRASVKLLKEAYNDAGDKNVVSSPLGVLLLLSMYSAGAGTNEGIKEEIVKALGSANYDELQKSYTNLSSRFSSMDSSYLTLANRLFVDDKFEVAEGFLNGPAKTYHSAVEKVKFTDPALAAAAINHWADEKTKGHIKEAVSADSIEPSAAAFLANVIFFQGHWAIPFNASVTAEQDFHVNKINTVKKPMMHLEQPLFYHVCPELGAKMVELPYTEHHFRMVIILPDEVDGLSSVLEKAESRGLLTDVFSLAPNNADIILDMPKFEIKSELNLNNLLPKVGVSEIFRSAATEIVNAPVKVSKAFQKAFVKVDEEGATAGAFTGAVMVPMSSMSGPPPPVVFKVDHPFLFAILHEDVILFTGTYTH